MHASGSVQHFIEPMRLRLVGRRHGGEHGKGHYYEWSDVIVHCEITSDWPHHNFLMPLNDEGAPVALGNDKFGGIGHKSTAAASSTAAATRRSPARSEGATATAAKAVGRSATHAAASRPA